MRFALISLLTLAAPVAALAAPYEIDAAHSSVSFKVRHLVSKTQGKFDKFDAKINFEPGKEDAWNVEAKIDAKSIDTSNAKRDEHLRSEDFFDVKKYPTITFKSTKVTDKKLEGELTMHGVTKPVSLDLEFGGEGTDPMGNKKIGFTASGKINRKDFGINWNKTLDKGGLVLGEDVEISIEVEANAAGAAAAPAKKGKK